MEFQKHFAKNVPFIQLSEISLKIHRRQFRTEAGVPNSQCGDALVTVHPQ
ncbi:hypothetical protein D3OALGA1CA_3989 [Olavius algarvensis associated proteobacterium Delta 3]|nr:hypothetical protein D3OALGB2SA_3387 [Olavius algarvensis associated proteobacterium Delta 3]CAB5143319.1 hypothetical protein D3OALGA1CA_3989 [Olavius algarvensis associated proteobacterium Delta 3]